jgi:hypothetical protein
MLLIQRDFLKERRIYEQRGGDVKGVWTIFPILALSARTDGNHIARFSKLVSHRMGAVGAVLP